MIKIYLKRVAGGTGPITLCLLLSVLAVSPSLFSDTGIARDLADDRGLVLYNLHSREKIKIDYCSDGTYVPDALTVIDRFLRDPLNGEVKTIDPKLLDLLFELHAKVGADAPFTVVCGYRSPKTNAALRARSRGVAEHSLHMEGKAVDIKVTGVPLAKLHKAALEMKAGGVGYYPKSGFIHVDVGPIRSW